MNDVASELRGKFSSVGSRVTENWGCLTELDHMQRFFRAGDTFCKKKNGGNDEMKCAVQ